MNITEMKSIRSWALVILVAIMVMFSWLAPLDSAATERVDASFKRALVSFGTARALNAVISFAQGTEISIQPMGVGLNLAPGQILDPINDLVEQLSQLLLIASVALGIQKILLAVGANWAISLTFTLIAAAWCTLHLQNRPSPNWLSKLLFIFLMMRFAIPVSVVGTDVLFKSFMAPSYEASQAAIEATSSELDKSPVMMEGSMAASASAGPSDGATTKPGFFGRLFGKEEPAANLEPVNHETVTNTAPPAPNATATAQSNGDKPGFFDKLNPKKKFESFKLSAEKAVENMIHLMVVFTLDTIILPILLLWAFISIGRGAFLSRSETAKLLTGK